MATETRKRFNAEFRAAHNSGAKEFEFPIGSGKMYTTKLEDDASSPLVKKQPQTAPAPFKPKSTSELSPAERKKRDDMESSQALESSHPELFLNPGRAILSAVAKPLATADKARSTVTTGVNAVKNSAPARALRESQFTRAAAKDADKIAAVERARAAARTTKDLEKKMPEFNESPMKRGGAVKKMAKGGLVVRGQGAVIHKKKTARIC